MSILVMFVNIGYGVMLRCEIVWLRDAVRFGRNAVNTQCVMSHFTLVLRLQLNRTTDMSLACFMLLFMFLV